MNRKGAYEPSNSIVLQAVKDYRAALSRQKVDCEVIISKIRKEFNQ